MEINPLKNLVNSLGHMLALYADVMGMQAENMQREFWGQAMAYNDDCFFEKAREIREFAEGLLLR